MGSGQVKLVIDLETYWVTRLIPTGRSEVHTFARPDSRKKACSRVAFAVFKMRQNEIYIQLDNRYLVKPNFLQYSKDTPCKYSKIIIWDVRDTIWWWNSQNPICMFSSGVPWVLVKALSIGKRAFMYGRAELLRNSNFGPAPNFSVSNLNETWRREINLLEVRVSSNVDHPLLGDKKASSS